jgi:superfamily II helicase
MPVGLKEDSVIGKCIFCAHRCKAGKLHHTGSTNADRHAFCHNTKWICGDCAIGMHDRIVSIHESVKEKQEGMEALLESMDDLNRSNFEIDMETGKLKFIGYDKYK